MISNWREMFFFTMAKGISTTFRLTAIFAQACSRAVLRYFLLNLGYMLSLCEQTIHIKT